MGLKSIWERRGSTLKADPAGAAAAREAEVGARPAEDDQVGAVQALSSVLRDFGHYAFDTDVEARTVDSACEQWARHLLYGAECPRASWSPEGGAALQHRDWTGVRHYLLDQRQREYAYVMRSVGGMRSAIWSFVHDLQRSLSAAHRNENEMAACLKRLDSVSRQDSVEAMRREIASTTAALSRLIAEKRQRESEEVKELQSRIEELGSELEEARQESMLDPLTRLYNRKALDTLLQRTMDKYALFGTPACLLLVDADHFKQVNDNYGHAAGDEALRALADCLTTTFPRKGDLAARYGGEEFGVIVPGASRTEGMRLAERLLAAARRIRVETDKGSIGITVSIGVAAPNRDECVEGWLQRADSALYAAKRAGRDRAVLAP